MISPENLNVLDAIVEYKNYHSSVILSYGVNLPFYEKGVISRLWKTNSRNNLIYMDAERYQDTISNFRDAIGFVGKRYLIVPVDLGVYQSFHPKLILLLGSDRGRLLIGSGNLTFPGYGDNLEVFTIYDWSDKQPENLSVFSDVWRIILSIQEKWGYSNQASRMLEKAEYQSPWLHDLSVTPNNTVFSSLDTPIIEGIQNILNGKKVKRITIFSPFLDEQGQGLRSLYKRFIPLEINLVLQPYHSFANPGSLQDLLNDELPLNLFQTIERDRYIHAKLYVFETEDSAYLFTGSANCTKAGLLSGTKNGNFELLTYREFSDTDDAIRFLDFGFQTKPVTDLTQIKLRRPTKIEFTQILGIKLLDAAIDGLYLIIKFQLEETQIPFQQIFITSDFPKVLKLSISEFTTGLNEHKTLLSEEFLTLTQGIFYVYIQGVCIDKQKRTLNSNAMWVTNQTELNKKVTFLTPDDETSARLLREKLLSDDQKWESLYKTLVDLVELDVSQLKKVSPTTRKRKSSKNNNEENEKESTLVVIDEIAERENRLEEIEAELNQESRLHSWLEIVLGMFPQDRKNGSTKKTTDVSISTSKKPSENIGKRFIRLIRRYIRVIQNEEFTISLSAYYLLAYFSIFQRITWILFISGVVSKEDYLNYSLEIFDSYFGPISEKSPPFFQPTVQNHLRWRYEAQWRESQAHLHAIINIHILQDIFSSDEYVQERLKVYFIQLLSCLTCIVPPEQILEDLDDLDHLADFYNCDGVELYFSLSKSIKEFLPFTLNILNEWILESDISLFRESVLFDPEILFNTRVTLGIGDLRVKKYSNKVGETINWDFLIQWCNFTDESNQNTNFMQKLVGVFRHYGLSSNVSKALFELAKSAKKAKRYEDSLELLDQVLLVAGQVKDEKLIKVVEFHRNMVLYLISMKA